MNAAASMPNSAIRETCKIKLDLTRMLARVMGGPLYSTGVPGMVA